MKIKLIAVGLLVGTLAGCSGSSDRDKQRPVLPDFPTSKEILPEQRGVVFTAPFPGETGIAPDHPIIVRFSHALAGTRVAGNLLPENQIDRDGIASRFTLREIANGVPVGAEIPLIASVIPERAQSSFFGQTILLQPAALSGSVKVPARLKEKTTYRLFSDTIELETGDVELESPGIPPLLFTTRAAIDGPALSQTLGSSVTDFRVTDTVPSSGTFPLTELSNPFPVPDFGTLRVQFSQPLDPQSVVYGSTVRLERFVGTTPVLVEKSRVRLLVDGNKLSVDPVDRLVSGSQYRLTLRAKQSSGDLGPFIKSRFGTPLPNVASSSITFTPRSTGATSFLQVTTPLVNGNVTNADKSLKSFLTGKPSNNVPVASPLLGGDGTSNPSIANTSGSLIAELASPGAFDSGVVPLRVPLNSKLTSPGLAVFIGGEVETPVVTKNLSIKLITDANGYLLPNKFNPSPVAPGLVTLSMDVALTAEDETSNGAFTQNIAHVVVNGIATVDQASRQLRIEGVGMIELKVLGVDDAVGLLSLTLVADTGSAPGSESLDTTGPAVHSWVPGNAVGAANQLAEAFVRPGDPVIVTFDEPVDPNTLVKGDSVRLDCIAGPSCPVGGLEPFNMRLDGASLILTAVNGFKHGNTYKVALSNAIKDYSGNAYSDRLNRLGLGQFKVPELATYDGNLPVDNRLGPNFERPPVIIGLSPGYPCPVTRNAGDLAAGIQGRCLGGKTSDDQLPLPLVQPAQPITVQFTQSVKPESLVLASSCSTAVSAASIRVFRTDASGNGCTHVPGRLIKLPRSVQFVPDSPWVKNALYRFVIQSNGSNTSSSCSGSQLAVCGANNLPLQTQLISQQLADVRNPLRGGPNLDLYFKGGDALSDVNAGLQVLPVLDTNANFILDGVEGRAVQATRLADGSYVPVSLSAAKCGTGPSVAFTEAVTPGSCIAPNGALLQPNRLHPSGSFDGAATRFSLGCYAANGAGLEDDDGAGSEDEPSGMAGRDCQGNQFLLINGGLSARLGAPVTIAGKKKIPVIIDPTIIITSGAQIFADLGITSEALAITPPEVVDTFRNIPLLGTLVGLLDGLLEVVDQLPPVNDSINVIDGTYRFGPTAVQRDNEVYTGPLVFRMRHATEQVVHDGKLLNPNKEIVGYIENVAPANQPAKLQLSASLSLYTDIPEINAIATVLGLPVEISHDVRSNEDISGAPTARGGGAISVKGDVVFLQDGRLTVTLRNEAPVQLTAGLDGLGGLLGGTLRVRVPEKRFVIDAALAPIKK